MPNLTAEQASKIANNFLDIAQVIGNYRANNWANIPIDENKQLGAKQREIIKYSEDMFALSATLILPDVDQAVDEINNVTENILHTIHQLANIQKGIDIASKVVALGAALFTENPVAILGALDDLTSLLHQ